MLWGSTKKWVKPGLVGFQLKPRIGAGSAISHAFDESGLGWLPGYPGDGLIVGRTTWEAFVGTEWLLLLVLPVATLRTGCFDSNLLWLAAHFILPPVGHIQMVNRELLKKAQYSSVAFWMNAEHPRIHTIPFSTILPDMVDILLDLLDQT